MVSYSHINFQTPGIGHFQQELDKQPFYLDRLRRSGKQISASLRTGMMEDPAIIQSKMLPPRPSSSKDRFKTDC